LLAGYHEMILKGRSRSIRPVISEPNIRAEIKARFGELCIPSFQIAAVMRTLLNAHHDAVVDDFDIIAFHRLILHHPTNAASPQG
jgi:hypothetical protein